MALGARLLPAMQQAQRVETAVEQRQRVIRRAVDQLFGQLHLIAAVAGKGTADQQMAGQLHLAHHAHLGKTGVAMLVAGAAVAFTVLRRIGCAPDHSIDTQ
ncbi:hypothetical protein D9M70_499980 [compost metagenome]